ncbi:hypothetical protein ACIP9H_09055 [Streptomyces sp. NPDC088732]|uniref:hypothetical protein n=1 Tax=Streptomyces sp. NPDC088732 TaxID=3365879 RepID=UPI00382F1EDD
MTVPQDHVLAGGWVYTENLRPLCEVVSGLAGHAFDDSDWQAVEYGLSTTDDDRPTADWFRYPLVGRRRVDLCLARSTGGSVVSLRLLGDADEALAARADAVIGVLAQYWVYDRPPQ